jgi:hypothetical protein
LLPSSNCGTKKASWGEARTSAHPLIQRAAPNGAVFVWASLSVFDRE